MVHTKKVINSGKVENPDNVVYDSVINDSEARYEATIIEYDKKAYEMQKELERLDDEWVKIQEKASRTMDYKEREKLFKEIEKIGNEMNQIMFQQDALRTESLYKIYSYLTNVYKELI